MLLCIYLFIYMQLICNQFFSYNANDSDTVTLGQVNALLWSPPMPTVGAWNLCVWQLGLARWIPDQELFGILLFPPATFSTSPKLSKTLQYSEEWNFRRAEYPIQSYLESLLPPPSPHPLKQSKTLQYSAEYIRRSEYPFHSYLKPTASPAASQNTIIGSNPHRSTCSIVNTQTMVIWDHLHLQQTRWVEIISASSSQPQPP